MKLHRLTLRNWRGVDEREVAFALTGVTVVEGPNESGKSSLVESLDALLDHFDDTKKREIVAVKPVHRDAGAEVLAEIESGPYRFVYSKRFHKRPETKLVVSQPAPENHTGREAHERARRMLEETMDLALWAALRIEQGQEIAQANLGEQKSLSAALTKAAGGAHVGDTETTLFDAARQEFLRWFTPTGAPRKETIEAESAVRRLEETLAADRTELTRLEADIERSARLERAVVDACRVAGESAAAQTRHDERLREIERLEGRLRELSAAHAAATVVLRDAEERAAVREELVRAADSAREAFSKLAQGDDLASPAFDAARRDLDDAERAFVDAARAAEAAERETAVRQRDFDFRKDELDLQLLSERRRRIERADAAAAEAERVLASSGVTDDLLKKLHAAHVELEKARAALAAGSPELRLRALADIAAVIDGDTRDLAAGRETSVPVSGSVVVVLPGVAEIEVRTGSSTQDLRDACEARARKFADACRAAAVESLEAAVPANAAWQAARRDIATRDRVLADDLRDLSRDQLAQKIAHLVPRVAAYPAARAAEFPIPADFDAAQDADRVAKSAVETARSSRATAERRREKARDADARLHDARVKTGIERAAARSRAELTSDQLAQARARTSDEEVALRVVACRQAAEDADATHRRESARLAESQPDAARLFAGNARDARRRADEGLRSIEDERIEVRARLTERGEAGLAERRDATEAKLARATDDLARRRVHAAAAKLLFTTLDEERSSARRAYVAPLRDRIDELGRVVYGTTFSVELDDVTLQIANRTLDGRTVPYESLSGGAKEQLGVISRLACALTVAEDGGVPLVLDDTLGNTDPGRIEAMCALLSLAGRRCQVIVLTCVPDRFRHVGGATVVRLG